MVSESEKERGGERERVTSLQGSLFIPNFLYTNGCTELLYT